MWGEFKRKGKKEKMSFPRPPHNCGGSANALVVEKRESSWIPACAGMTNFLYFFRYRFILTPRFLFKTVAIITLLAFITTNASLAQSAPAINASAEAVDVKPLTADISIPKELGTIESQHAAEGAKGAFDPLLLRTFPDQDTKSKVMMDYLKKGEIAGAEMAALFPTEAGSTSGGNEQEASFYGIEDWKLYEENYVAYLRAVERRDDILKALGTLRKELDALREKIYSPGLNKFHEQREAFYEEREGLVEFVRYVSEANQQVDNSTLSKHSVIPAKAGIHEQKNLLQEPANLDPRFSAQQDGGSVSLIGGRGDDKLAGRLDLYPHLSVLIRSIDQNESLDPKKMNSELRQMAKNFKEKYSQKLDRETLMKVNKSEQAFVTGQLDMGRFLKILAEAGRSAGIELELPLSMKELLDNSESLAAIKGTALFKEFEKWIIQTESEVVT